MFLSKYASPESGIAKAGFLIASLLTGASLVVGVMAGVKPAVASDYEPAAADGGRYESAVEESGRFVRLGLNKSAVVRLPSDAKDVIVGNPDIVDVVVRTKNTAYLFARKEGQTNVFFFDGAGQQILSLDLEVALDVTGIRKLLQRALPGTRITADTMNGGVILGGIAQSAVEAKTALDLAKQFVGATGGEANVVNTIKIAGDDQVMLKVRVVEVQRNVIKQFGVDFTALLELGKFAFNLSSVNPFNAGPLSSSGGYKGAFKDGGNQVETLIRAMEKDGLLRTLAEPNLTAVTGKSATFHAGGEFSIGSSCSSSSSTSSTCGPNFKEYGVTVGFTPIVLDEGRINLTIDTAVSELGDISVGGIPSLNTRKASTVLELPSGGSMMIAGLISESTRQNVNGTPGLKKIPVLGTLFRSRDFVSNETELVIIVTPYLVRATGEKQLLGPDKGFNPPTDRQAIFLGRLNKVYGTGKKLDGDYNGNVGFIVE